MLNWRVGGSSDVDTTTIYYDYFDDEAEVR